MGKTDVDGDLHPGVYETLVTSALRRRLSGLRDGLVREGTVDPAEGPIVLAQYVQDLVRRRLAEFPSKDADGARVRLVNALLDVLESGHLPDRVAESDRAPRHLVPGPRQLLEVLPAVADLGDHEATPRPEIALGAADVLLGDRGERSARAVIESEFPSADRVDLICSFLKWSGYRLLRDAIRRHVRDKGRSLRVLTTTYVGVTERKVLDDLHRLGAEVRVSYEHQRTRLHAKAWTFHRRGGLSTAIIGSSNVTHSALVDGLEWNVRLAARVTPDALAKIAATFEAHWNGDEFAAYDPERDGETFDQAIRAAGGDGTTRLRALIELRPHAFQQEMLDRLATERAEHGRHRNLIVAATGTGKTVVAALDFARLRSVHPEWRLLFVAHRREILEQARDTYRHALGDRAFGDLLLGGHTPRRGASVFATIQSLNADRIAELAPETFDVVVVDEFHHAAAASYQVLLDHVRPRELLGLTATPERADDVRVQDAYFGGRIAAELRLWDALDRGLLVPFHYFGVADGTDLRSVRWNRGYDAGDLSRVFIGDERRLRHIFRAIDEYVPDVRGMRALGFCVGVQHAEWMAHRFRQNGIPATALSGQSTHAERDQALAALRQQPGRVIFTADLFNEGVDVPEVDVVLFLRPTDSHVLFQQQLGRGLRRSRGTGKSCLTVLDFVGHNHGHFRAHRRLSVLCGGATRRDVERDIEGGFAVLPPGCAMQLEEQARDTILENIRSATGANVRRQVEELRLLGPETTLDEFLERTGSELHEVYRGKRSWTELRRRAGFDARVPDEHERRLGARLGQLTHVDDRERIDWIAAAAQGRSGEWHASAAGTLRWLMLEALLTGRAAASDDASVALRERIARPSGLREELVELTDILRRRVVYPTYPCEELPTVPLRVHGSYATREALAALGLSGRKRIDSGVFRLDHLDAEAFFVTLVKSERDYSPTTLYRDYAISPELFHWESQSTTSRTSETGRRYLTQRATGRHILLFVRERRQRDGQAAPYTFLGLADHVSDEGSRPIAIVWRLRRPMPARLFREAALVQATA